MQSTQPAVVVATNTTLLCFLADNQPRVPRAAPRRCTSPLCERTRRSASYHGSAVPRVLTQSQSRVCGLARQVALRLVARAALAGHAPAMCNVGMSFETGVGAPVDPSAAVKWYRVRPHAQTHAPCRARRGAITQCTTMGSCGGHRIPRALQAAWAKGCALGALNLGCAFLNAVGVDADPPRAVRLLEAAAELGNADAKYPACGCARA